MSNSVLYFSHDSNARNDEKILMLRQKFGCEGYGVYWCLIEMMFENSATALRMSNITGIAYAINVKTEDLTAIINFCIECELFFERDNMFYSKSLLRRKNKMLDIKQKRSEAGKKGMKKRWKSKPKSITNVNYSQNNSTNNTESDNPDDVRTKSPENYYDNLIKDLGRKPQ